MLAAIPLHTTAKERRQYDDLADLYSIIKVTETLEKAYARDIVPADEYTRSCSKLLSQFKSTVSALLPILPLPEAQSDAKRVQEFMALYSLDCPRAYTRLAVDGVPATTLHAGSSSSSSSSGGEVVVAECVQFFITAMDALKLELRSVDELQPRVADVLEALNRVAGLPKDFEGARKLEAWLRKLNGMRAVEEINDEDTRQLAHDLDHSYAEFHRFLKAERK
jgi:ESCRT-I complex subunit VPS28